MNLINNFILFISFYLIFGVFNAQNTIFSENIGGSYVHNESMSTNSSGWSHTGTGDFVHKIVSGNGAFGSNCFAQLNTSGASSASKDIQLYAVVTGPQCDYVINMQDSYGDGWNGGASIDVSVNGNNVANSSISGSYGTDTISTINGDVVEFFFNSGTWDTEITFQITKPDGSTLGSYGPFATNSGNSGIIATDTSNATCLPATVNVTFQVDMGLVTAGFTTPEVNGTWNSWCGNCNPMTDADGDGVWEATIPLSSGSYEYKYSADTWNIQEMNDPNASCTNGDPVNTNRVLTVGTSDMTISTVCWGSCSPCIYPGTCGIYTLELTDSYGDGWNGGSLDVVVNGTAVFSGLTIATGFWTRKLSNPSRY